MTDSLSLPLSLTYRAVSIARYMTLLLHRWQGSGQPYG
ncbi:hypothetical protein E2C01_064358 [Portunus trituberculatus]|uniref:Uncharacterized protein n=1 Tax=Portunus trituberculatus TaxID=210409 RepID=A0A5B7HK45_PORTR|nr:hypothetical protein [Portunus trituberculatus]